MVYCTKSICILLVVLFSTLHSCRSKTPWNPYLSAKEKPSDKQRKEEQKQMKIGTKAYNEQIKKNKKEIRENNNKAMSMKKHYKKTTKNGNKRKRKKAGWRF